MNLHFNDIPEVSLEHFNGGNGCFVVRKYDDGMNRIIRGTLAPGSSIGMHTHTDSSETFYVISGAGRVFEECCSAGAPISAGDCHHCPKGHSHMLVNDGTEDLVILAVIPKQ
ncbi:MAG: cupin domain-containing protein [Clostridia bacterium]|nr:cupin domain-containing protein [Clostridia bacterium]